MKIIGDTIGGTLIVEMTRQEWTALNGEPVKRDAANKTQDKRKWYQRFSIDLQHLGLDVRYHNALLRCVHTPFDKGVFAANGRYLDFEEWVLTVHERKDALLLVRHLGKIGVKEIMKAADRYLIDCTKEPA